MRVMNIPGTYYPDGSVAYSIPKYSTHALSLNNIREMYERSGIYAYEDHRNCTIKLYSRHEVKHLNHARLGQCPNCGANDWSPSFMLNTDELYELINYSCAYCGTRKEDQNG